MVNVEGQLPIDIPNTTHQIGKDTWLQVCFVLTTAINSAYVLGYSAGFMVPLGWVAGVVGLVAVTAISLYTSCLFAKIHELGGTRHIRFRDLAGHIYGSKAYYLTWTLQYANLFLINIGYIIVAGQALKAAYVLLWDNNTMKLPYFIAIAGLVSSAFAISIPHLSALRIWLGVSAALSLVYIITAIVLTIRDGIKAPAKDYSIPGSEASKVFRTVSAAAALFFTCNPGMLPEIQATARQPVVENMLKALYLQFTVGVLPMYAVAFVGYWAFGTSAPSYLLSGISGPIWLKTTANLAAFFQSVVSLHVFASPAYEYLDTKYGPKGSASCVEKTSFRITVRGGYLAITTFLAALIPFLGDVMSLTGAVSTLPLTFILGNHMYLMARGNKLNCAQRLWHWLNIGFFSLFSVAAAVASVRLISVDSKTYHLFADL